MPLLARELYSQVQMVFKIPLLNYSIARMMTRHVSTIGTSKLLKTTTSFTPTLWPKSAHCLSCDNKHVLHAIWSSVVRPEPGLDPCSLCSEPCFFSSAKWRTLPNQTRSSPVYVEFSFVQINKINKTKEKSSPSPWNQPVKHARTA